MRIKYFPVGVSPRGPMCWISHQYAAICATLITTHYGGQTMRSAVLLGMLLSAFPPAAHATVLVCRGSISQEWGYLTITTEEGIECIVTRRVGMQTVINICGGKRCKV